MQKVGQIEATMKEIKSMDLGKDPEKAGKMLNDIKSKYEGSIGEMSQGRDSKEMGAQSMQKGMSSAGSDMFQGKGSQSGMQGMQAGNDSSAQSRGSQGSSFGGGSQAGGPPSSGTPPQTSEIRR